MKQILEENGLVMSYFLSVSRSVSYVVFFVTVVWSLWLLCGYLLLCMLLYYYLTDALLLVSLFVWHVQQVELARRNEDLELFSNNTHPQFNFMKVVRVNISLYFSCGIYASSVELIDFPSFAFQKEVIKSRNKNLVELFEFGMGVHHAGMLRADRGLTERLFSGGLLKVELIPL